MSNVKKAEGKLGVMVVGLGAVSSTFMTGVLMARKGLAKPVGSMTQYDKIRVGEGENKKYLKYNEIVPLADLNDIVFGAWDVYPANAYESAINCEVLKEKDINPVKDELEKIVPMKAAFDHNYAKRLDGDNVKTCPGSPNESRRQRAYRSLDVLCLRSSQRRRTLHHGRPQHHSRHPRNVGTL